VDYIIHRVADVTSFVHLQQEQQKRDQLTDSLRARASDMESEIYQRAQEIALANRELLLENERRQVAEALLANQRAALERSNAELSQFASVASHDLQEPLRMVGSYCTMLGDRYRGRLDADADEIIGFAVDGAQRMRALIQDLLTYAKVDGAGGKRERVAMASALDEALAALRGAITDSGATVTRGPLPNLIADHRQMIQLLQNLVGNALKYRSIAPPVVHVAAERDGDAWAVSVADNGIGIDPRHHERIFGMFKRLHGRERYPGTGIGLAICRKIVEVHDGIISVASTKGAGATFRFTIPDRDLPTEPSNAR
jgi:light-regulated signal transduction histidine kinase (bacteriophytochrome)